MEEVPKYLALVPDLAAVKAINIVQVIYSQNFLGYQQRRNKDSYGSFSELISAGNVIPKVRYHVLKVIRKRHQYYAEQRTTYIAAIIGATIAGGK
jgi:hypothetical protein